MNYTALEVTHQPGVAVLWLNRPERRNALDRALIDELTHAIAAAQHDPAVGAIMLAGRGKAFCAGADLNWMQSAAEAPPAVNEAEALRLAELLRALAESPKPTLARVHGPAFAGGLGLVAACDLAVASYEASFCLTEVRIGLAPAVISPYVVRALGPRAASRYMLTGELFDGGDAFRLGLVHEIVPAEALDENVNALLGNLLQGGPQALAATKQLIREASNQPLDATLRHRTAQRIATLRAGDEAREGMAAFLARRPPQWARQS